MAKPSADNLRALVTELTSDPGPLLLSPIPGGASRETWLVKTESGPGAEKAPSAWVLRRDPKGSVSLVPIEHEFALMCAARDAGVPVPQPLSFEPAGGRFGSAAMLMSFVDG